ncbi:bifunctional 5,10-methylenetetrahydrofolate dehydrogenase/5,10-methenyltetrahydrofolate cyclohydrolase [Jiangella ureilytica]|uniref:Bifunctional protein FolD n=1 Tax=Jiangella ureilytica TaxID=2530374 RepID=A0A4R4RCR7_9ACTN|nr:bifunctional 5,10-methylenetetrahydrofolate dehydrogenase/5,10-methenyltetrahydrofolate cyclohydrolase [Jiangella ureilytica]TDC46950.1 bifunctional 5,10-methylenetetrahydrofolate dehydrogenase/5,10-methenyltetrahydrofolate cyclohydrolase [Jiangella ureilytica]
MTAQRLGGSDLAARIRAHVAGRAAARRDDGRPARLVIVTATDDEASAWYVRSLAAAAGKAGIDCDVADLGPVATAGDLTARLTALSADPAVDGVMLQTPLPAGVTLAEVSGAIDPAKDVDGANPLSLGRLAVGRPAYAPATAAAVVALLDEYVVDLAGARAVVVGRSAVVGKPLAHLLLDRDATVTVCHSRTRDLAEVTSTADVLVAAVGRTHLITPTHVRAGAVVIDVGTNPTPDGGLAGDVDPAVAEVAAALTPVPGGVGPVTTALLLWHTVADSASAPGDSP